MELSLWHLGSESLICKLKPKISTRIDNNKNEELDINDDNNIIYESVQVFNGQILAGGRSNTAQWNGSQLQRFNYAGEHVHSLKIGGISAISSISTYISGKIYKAANITLIAGDSSKIFCLSDLGYLSHSINTSNAKYIV